MDPGSPLGLSYFGILLSWFFLGSTLLDLGVKHPV